MLGIGRYPGESVIINGNVQVKVLSVRGKKVRLGFDAPKEVEIWREELQPPVNNDVQPRWCDKPTGPGRWYGCGAIWHLNEDAVAEWHSDPKYDSYPRMYGPIPDDPEGKQ